MAVLIASERPQLRPDQRKLRPRKWICMEVYRSNAENTTPNVFEPHARYGFRASALEVKAAIPLSRYCADVGIELKPSGVRLVGACPFHAERTPSFTIYADTSYYCFGCMATGDVIDLHEHLENHSAKWTALVDLAQRYNVEL